MSPQLAGVKLAGRECVRRRLRMGIENRAQNPFRSGGVNPTNGGQLEPRIRETFPNRSESEAKEVVKMTQLSLCLALRPKVLE
jgi:hypothetical protein